MKNLNRLYIIIIAIITLLSCNTNQLSEKLNYDLNVKVTPSDIAECEFYYTNVSSTPMIVKHIQYSCGCMAGNNSEVTIEPKDSTLISFSMKVKKDEESSDRKVTLWLADSTKKELNIKMNFTRELVFSPSNGVISFPKIHLDSTYSKEFTLENNTNSPCTLKEIGDVSNKFELNTFGKNYPAIINPGETCKFRLEFKSDTLGLFSTKIPLVLETDKLYKVNLFAYAKVI